MSSASGTRAFQVLLSGQLVDGLTGRALRGPATVRLLDVDDPEPTDYPLAGTVTSDARFAFHGDPDTAFPLLAQRGYRLRVRAEAARHSPAHADVEVPATEDQPAEVTVAVPIDGLATVRLFTGAGLPAEDLTLTLQPEPVRLEGRVVVSSDPRQSVPGATLQVTDGPTATSGDDGRYAFASPMPLRSGIELTVTAAGFEPAVLTHELAYTQVVNTLPVLLRRAST